MKKLIIPVFCALMVSMNVNAQKTATAKIETAKGAITPAQVIDNYINALGGRVKLEAVKTTITESEMTVQGMEVKMVTKKMGNKFSSKQEIPSMGMEMKQVFDGEKGYIEQMGQKQDFPEAQMEKLRNGKTIEALALKPESFKSVETETIDGKKYYVLAGETGTNYFDAETGLLKKMVSEVATSEILDYHTVDGIKFPKTTKAIGGGQEMEIKNTKVTINSGVTDEDFK